MELPTRRTLSIALVAVLVATAGCSGFGSGGDATPTPEEPTPTQTPTNGTAPNATATPADGGDGTPAPTATPADGGDGTPAPTATPSDGTPTPTPTDGGDGTDGNATDGNTTDGDELSSLDQTLLDRHALTLLEAGNYTAFVTTSGNGSSTTTVSAVDLTALSYYDQITSASVSIEEYRPPASPRVYQQVGTGSDASYFNNSATGDFTASDISRPYLVTDVNYQQFGTDTADGVTVQRYIANGPSSLNVTSDAWEGSFVTNISSTVLVDASRNLIYEIDTNYTVQTAAGDTVEYSYTVQYSSVGETNVTAPSWLSDAR